MDTPATVLDRLEAAVEDGERRAVSRAEHIRWETVRSLLAALRMDDRATGIKI